jgi:formimidoylglutamate deiminase
VSFFSWEIDLTETRILEADWTWTGQQFESGIQIAVTPAGLIERVGRSSLPATERLTGQALLPGMINTHSHAFQRGLRGRGDHFPAGVGDFWSWREAMYQLVEQLDPEPFHRLCLQAFREMLAGGTTTVGEFHYFHHTRGTTDYAFDQIVLGAAKEAGIRMVLLLAYYRTGGVGKPLEGGQRRFATATPQEYWSQMDRLASMLDGSTQTLGAVAHSIRAATPHEIGALHAESLARRMPFHIHVEEQQKEVEDAVACYGAPPMALLTRAVPDCSNVTAIHCTHTDPEDMTRYLAQGGRVCLCPLTEGNLGDGIPSLAAAHRAGNRLCLGSDSNNRISMFEDMRWLEYGQRLANQSRGVLRPEDGRLGRTLFEAATLGGAAALGLPVGTLKPGAPADCFAIDLKAPALAGWTPEMLLDSMIFGTDPSVVAGTAVGGKWVYRAASLYSGAG